MALTLDILAGIIEASPHGRAACRALKCSPAQAAYSVLADLAATRDEGMRDAMIGMFFQEHGIYGVASAQDAEVFLGEVVERYTGQSSRLEGWPFERQLSREQQLDHYARASRDTPTQWRPHEIARVAEVATRAAMSQGLNAKMRATDRARFGREPIAPTPENRAHAEDTRHRREWLERAWSAHGGASAARMPDYAGKAREQFSRRDAIENAYDRAWVDAETQAQGADALEAAREGVNTEV